MDLRSKVSTGKKETTKSPEYAHVARVSSGVKDVTTVDPRWPLLNRWSSPLKISSAEISPTVQKPINVAPTTVSVQPEASQLTGNSPIIPLEADSSLKGNKAQTNVKNLSSMAKILSPEDLHLQKESTFSTSLGAWKKPLQILSPSLQQGPEVVKQSNSQWPPLSADKSSASTYMRSDLVQNPSKVSVLDVSETEQATMNAHSKEYPWAARMNPSMRNLHRVTIPEYMEDGTPKVRIPSHVLLSGLENQKEFVVGQFYRCLAPTGGQIQAVVTRIWGRKCRIFTRKLGESTYLFHIPDESTRKWVLQRGLWHVDDCLLFVSPWSPSDTISIPEITTVPVWLTLLNIPDQLYSILGIKWIASGIGEPLLTEKPWLDPTQMGKAKILVEVKLDKPFPKRVALIDNSDAITMVDVSYSWLPSTCTSCGQLGHKASRCLLQSTNTAPAANISDNSMDSSKLKRNNGKAPINDFLSIVQEERTEQVNPCISVPLMTTPIISQETNAPTSTTPKAAAQMAKGTATKASTQEASTSKQLTPPVKGDSGIHRCLSSLSLSTNRYASLDSSGDDDDDAPSLPDEAEPIEFLTPLGKRILREKPVKPSEKVKEMQGQTARGGRGNRGRGTRGSRG